MKVILKKIQIGLRNIAGKKMLNRNRPWRRGLSMYHRVSLMVMRARHCHRLQTFSMLSNYDDMKVVTTKQASLLKRMGLKWLVISSEFKF